MELISQKTPLFPQDWSIGRVVAWFAKLGVFVLVPGLHQIACKRRILGGLLMVMYFVTEFAVENRPLDFYPRKLFDHPDITDMSEFDHFLFYVYINYDFHILAGFHHLDQNLARVPLYFSWFLLFLDVRKLERRSLTLNWFLVIVCLTATWFWPERHPYFSNLFVVQTNIGCPQICKNGIVAWHSPDPGEVIPNTGQLVVRDDLMMGPIMARILPGTPEQLCNGELPESWVRPGELDRCNNFSQLSKRYRVDVGAGPVQRYGFSQRIYWAGPTSWTRTSFSKIGNTRKYFVLNDSVTDFVGHTLFQIYNWTEYDPLNFINYSLPKLKL